MRKDIVFGIIIGLAFVCLIVLFCIILIKLYFTKIKNYTHLLYQKDLDFQKALTSTITETQEQVLNNISQDLHDDAGQQLTYINFQIENMKLDSPELKLILEPLSQSVGSLSESIRSISHSLNNQLLTQQNLFKAIEAETERIQKNRHIGIHYSVSGTDGKAFETNEKIVIYRIFQEVINNILKHSKATAVTIKIKTTPFFEMCISDNGKGFDYEHVKNGSNSIGLQNISSRAEIIGYHINIKSAPEKGTTVILSENKTN